MKDFAARLEEEAEKKVEKIEAGDLNMIKKSFEASLVLADAFLQLKAFIADYTSVTRQRKSSSSRRSNPESVTGSSTTARYTTSR